jgi:hypothetical protein
MAKVEIKTPRHLLSHKTTRLCWLTQKRAERRAYKQRPKARETKSMPLVTRTLLALEIDRRDLTNRVSRGHVCPPGSDFRQHRKNAVRSTISSYRISTHCCLEKPSDTVGQPISMPKADLSAREFPSSLCSKKLYTGKISGSSGFANNIPSLCENHGRAVSENQWILS